MARPDPQRGQVVRYEYLWASEALQDGLSEGEYPRPCAVVVQIAPKDGGPLQAMLCGITHTEPRPPSEGILVPPDLKRSLGLDDQPSWVITSEVNTVNWSDRRFVKTPSGQWEYGVFPRELMEEIRDRMMVRIRAGSMDVVNRPEIDKRVSDSEKA